MNRSIIFNSAGTAGAGVYARAAGLDPLPALTVEP